MARPQNDGMEDRQLFGSGADTPGADATWATKDWATKDWATKGRLSPGAEPALPESLADFLGPDCPSLPPAGTDFLKRVLRTQLVAPVLVRRFLDQKTSHLADYTDAIVLGRERVEADPSHRTLIDSLMDMRTPQTACGNP